MKKKRAYPIYPVRFLFLCALITNAPNAVSSSIDKHEEWYQKVWCDGYNGITEARQNDGSRVDCLTESHAIEMEFANNWREAIGQSLHYALKTERQAGIVLILKKKSDEHHWTALKTTITHYNLPIKLWRLGP